MFFLILLQFLLRVCKLFCAGLLFAWAIEYCFAHPVMLDAYFIFFLQYSRVRLLLKSSLQHRVYYVTNIRVVLQINRTLQFSL
jgi:hypothetical protein